MTSSEESGSGTYRLWSLPAAWFVNTIDWIRGLRYRWAVPLVGAIWIVVGTSTQIAADEGWIPEMLGVGIVWLLFCFGLVTLFFRTPGDSNA